MEKFVDFLKKRLAVSQKVFGGFFVGEKTLALAMNNHFVYLCSDFVQGGKVKRGLESFGRKCAIISCGREIEDENDRNLLAFAQNISKFLRNEIDGLIFLPSSLTTKFDLEFLRKNLVLQVGKDYSLEELEEKLVDFGFERVGYASAIGQFAVRGDVVDIFVDGENPTRIEFFDETIDSIKIFDFSTMKTVKTIEKLEIFPIKLKFGKDDVFSICENIFIDEPSKILNECSVLELSREELSWTKGKDLFLDFSAVDFTKYTIFSNTDEDILQNHLKFENKTIGQKSYVTDFMSLKNDIKMYSKSGLLIFLFAGDYSAIIREFLTTNNINFRVFDGTVEELCPVYVVERYFPYSFSFLDKSIVGIGTDDMYKNNSLTKRLGRQVFSYLPKVGDYVVHAFYGIGRCKDIVRMKLSLFEKDYFVLEYKNGALLYLPSEQTNLLSAYVGGDDPKLNALGTSEWTKLKQKVRADLKEIAITLAKIYKERQTKKGFKFTRIDELEKQFSDSFAYELTPDQASAINDVDKDMESDKIMDRLICGDVGFGKTEVAFRAIFKAIYNSKQVAFLCPTTILSEQHFRSAKQRYEGMGFRIEVLNRFKTSKETEEILERLKNGEIDLLIGTHKILSEKVRFKDLGLLVLDEEQRFGVSDKEKIKKIKTNIDVLTLSATPIPRTLHMSLSGIRDISVIASAPKDRLPIQTYVSSYSDQLLQDVVSRELSRQGKALILFNRVAEIYTFRAHVAELLPQAKIGVAHGQMEERELARVINDLYENKFNLLISTTLIENGIDLPDLNTLFVVDCDMLGLGQLYQIRGRIGRSNKLAYAYLTYNAGKVLTEDAYKRLEAIKEFRELGSGFKIAIRDLEIRGAGDILGKQQHGHMQKVGYDMYVRLLDEVTKEVSGEKFHREKEIKMELVLDAYISEEYIPAQEERIVFYNKISNIQNQQEFDSVINELKALAGDVPREVVNLCKVAFLKNLASNFNVEKIIVNKNECLIQLYKSEEIIDKRLSNLGTFYDIRLKFEQKPILKVNANGNVAQKVNVLIEMFSKALQN